jgi:hypothetical protein
MRAKSLSDFARIVSDPRLPLRPVVMGAAAFSPDGSAPPLRNGLYPVTTSAVQAVLREP